LQLGKEVYSIPDPDPSVAIGEEVSSIRDPDPSVAVGERSLYSIRYPDPAVAVIELLLQKLTTLIHSITKKVTK
jgi:hypothetical protein